MNAGAALSMITVVKAAAKLSPFHPKGASLGVAESSVDAVVIPKYQQLPLVDQVPHQFQGLISRIEPIGAPALDTSTIIDGIIGKEDVTWINSQGGVWHDPANWDTGAIPIEIDHALLTLDGDYSAEARKLSKKIGVKLARRIAI